MSDETAGRTPASAGTDPSTGSRLSPMRSCRRSSRGCVPAAWASWRCAPTAGASACAATLSRSDRGARRPAARPPKRGGSASLPGSVARSPAVGYFTPAPDLVVGRSVQAGDLLGSIDVLGIAQEVTAPERRHRQRPCWPRMARPSSTARRSPRSIRSRPELDAGAADDGGEVA